VAATLKSIDYNVTMTFILNNTSSYQRGGENFQFLATGGRQRGDNQRSGGDKQSRDRQVKRRLSQIIGRPGTVVVFTGTDEVAVDIAKSGKLT